MNKNQVSCGKTEGAPSGDKHQQIAAYDGSAEHKSIQNKTHMIQLIEQQSVKHTAMPDSVLIPKGG